MIRCVIWNDFLKPFLLYFPHLYNEVKEHIGLLWRLVNVCEDLGIVPGILVAKMVKNQPAMQETWLWYLGWEDPLEEGMAAHFNILAWKSPWTIIVSKLIKFLLLLLLVVHPEVSFSVLDLSQWCKCSRGNVILTKQDPIGLQSTKAFLGSPFLDLPWGPKGRFKQSGKGEDAETREEQARNNSAAWGQNPIPKHSQDRIFEFFCRTKVKVKLLSHVQLFATPQIVAYQASPSMGFSRQVYWWVAISCRIKMTNKWKMFQRKGHSLITSRSSSDHLRPD